MLCFAYAKGEFKKNIPPSVNDCSLGHELLPLHVSESWDTVKVRVKYISPKVGLSYFRFKYFFSINYLSNAIQRSNVVIDS